MIDIAEIKYPHLDRILLLRPNPEIVLGKEIYWTIKEDGSNLGVALTPEGDLALRTRNMSVASEEFYKYFQSTDEIAGVHELLADAQNWNDGCVVFGELCVKGRSPARTEVHDRTHFVVFDIWSQKIGRFMNYTQMHQQCHHFELPCVELIGICNVNTRDALFEFKDQMLTAALERGKEGVVGKAWDENPWNTGAGAGTKRGIIYFKEKLDTPKLEKIPRSEVHGTVALPVLPDSEVSGAIEKAYADLGADFFDVRKAMPLVAQYVAEECRKHNCTNPKDLYPRYLARVRDLQEGGARDHHHRRRRRGRGAARYGRVPGAGDRPATDERAVCALRRGRGRALCVSLRSALPAPRQPGDPLPGQGQPVRDARGRPDAGQVRD